MLSVPTRRVHIASFSILFCLFTHGNKFKTNASYRAGLTQPLTFPSPPLSLQTDLKLCPSDKTSALGFEVLAHPLLVCFCKNKIPPERKRQNGEGPSLHSPQPWLL
jgi:hypothetical protein